MSNEREIVEVTVHRTQAGAVLAEYQAKGGQLLGATVGDYMLRLQFAMPAEEACPAEGCQCDICRGANEGGEGIPPEG